MIPTNLSGAFRKIKLLTFLCVGLYSVTCESDVGMERAMAFLTLNTKFLLNFKPLILVIDTFLQPNYTEYNSLDSHRFPLYTRYTYNSYQPL